MGESVSRYGRVGGGCGIVWVSGAAVDEERGWIGLEWMDGMGKSGIEIFRDEIG